VLKIYCKSNIQGGINISCGCRDKRTGRTAKSASVVCAMCGTKINGRDDKIQKWGKYRICARCMRNYRRMKEMEAEAKILAKKAQKKAKVVSKEELLNES